jgi:exopolysaccharide biosynthesis protein
LSTAIQLLESTRKQLRGLSWVKRSLLLIAVLAFLSSSFLFLTAPGTSIRVWLAHSVIITQHRDWAWIFVGAEQRDEMVRKMHLEIEENAAEKQDMGIIRHKTHKTNRSIDELIKVEDISDKLWKGKRMYVYDPKSIRVMTPVKAGEGERITSMVKRTGAVAGVNGGGFDDPEGLGNGFAALGAIISGGEIIFTDQDGSVKQHIVGFTKEGTLVIGKYDMNELLEMGISEAASFYPRVIANGKPLPITDPSRAPRTAVGQKADGTVIFIVIDGRQAHSVGATLKEVQELFLADDVINAGFLDGGASSELVVNGELVTKPSSRYGERRLPSAFLVYDHPEDVVANRVWDGVDKIDAGGSHDHPDFLREQAELKARQKNNPAPPAAPKTETEKPGTTDKTKTTETGSGTTKPVSPTKPSTSTEGKEDSTKAPAAPSGGSKEPVKTAPVTTPSGSTGTEPAKPPAGGTTGTNTAPTPAPPAGTTPQGGNPAGTGSGTTTPGGTSPGATGAGSATPGGTAPAKDTVPKTTTPAPSGTGTGSSTNSSTSSGSTVSPATPATPAPPNAPASPVIKP